LSERDLVAEWGRLGVALWLADGGVHGAPAIAVSPELAARMRVAMAELVSLLGASDEDPSECTAKTDRSPLLSAMAVPRSGGRAVFEPEGLDAPPHFDGWNCGPLGFASDHKRLRLACHSSGELLEHRERCTVLGRRGGGA